MRTFLRQKLAELRRCKSGNATMLVALGMPMLIGGGGLGVDVAQWYMWKRELQYAVDQAAIGGAWAASKTSTAGTYVDRARQEFNANLSINDGQTTVPVVQLANYAGGTNNSVAVSASVTRSLPFTHLITGRSATIGAYAQASFEDGTTFTSCLLAVDEHEDDAIIVGGNTVLTAGCGMMALSDSAEAITVDGNPTVDLGKIVAAGGIDDWFTEHTDDVVLENFSGLFDPYKDLTPPNPTESQGAGSYNCVQGKTTSKANQTTDVTTTYSYWKGADPINNPSGMSAQNYNNRTPNGHSNSTVSITVDGIPVDGVTTTTTWTKLSGQNANALWEKKVTVTGTTYTDVVTVTPPDTASVKPGTFAGGIRIQCNTVFAPGVYILDGGGLDITGQYTVTGAAVMFVLKNGAYVDIRGGSNIALTAMQASDLTARGVSLDQANLLAGMLVFEDRDSPGTTSKNNINGNALTVLNGTIYLPKSNVDFSGTATVTSQCLMVAARTIRFVGDANMSTFCPAGQNEDTVVARTTSKIKLVA